MHCRFDQYVIVTYLCDLSQCTKACGGGYQYRRAICKQPSGKPAPQSRCDVTTRVISQRCNTEGCPVWELGAWQQCSASCGEGTQQRHLWCKRGDVTVSKTQCDPDTEPIRTQTCNVGECAQWVPGEWTKVSHCQGQLSAVYVCMCTVYC